MRPFCKRNHAGANPVVGSTFVDLSEALRRALRPVAMGTARNQPAYSRRAPSCNFPPKPSHPAMSIAPAQQIRTLFCSVPVRVAQLEEYVPPKDEVVGASPSTDTIFSNAPLTGSM